MGVPRILPAVFALLTAACVVVSPTSTALPSPSLPAASSAIVAPTASPTASPSPTPPSTLALPTPTAIAAVPKAVIIVGPTDELTEENLALGDEMAQKAQAAGMDVHRVFFPHATWDIVLAEIQGASLVAYFGHGYGWPSNTPELWEVQQDGMGLNAYDGGGIGEVHYYGANKIRDSIRLAPHAVVFLMRGCYTAGNGLNSAPIPPVDVARQHVDNYASGWLAAGAGAVFAFAFGTNFDYAEQLMSGDATIDELFNMAHDAFGTGDLYFDSMRTPGARNHLDPSASRGFLRAVTGDLALSAGMWRSGAGQTVAF